MEMERVGDLCPYWQAPEKWESTATFALMAPVRQTAKCFNQSIVFSITTVAASFNQKDRV